MKKIDSIEKYQKEKAIVDAVLKISEIIKKITTNKQHSQQSIGDGDRREHSGSSQVPIPPSMRTLESYVSSFSKQQVLSSSNCNRAPVSFHPYGNISSSDQ